MRTLNRVMLIGHLASDVEMRQTKSGKVVAKFPVATNRLIMKNKEKESIADYHRIIAFGKLAEVCDEYLAKGSAVYLSGNLVNKSYKNKQGEKKYSTEIVLGELNILTWKKENDGSNKIQIEEVVNDEKELSVA